MTKKTENLIEELSGKLEPVKPLAHPLWRMLPLIIVSLLYLTAIIIMLGPRKDWALMMFGDLSFAFEFTLSMSIFISSALALGWLSIPDMRGQTWIKAVPITLLSVFAVWASLRLAHEGMDGFHLHVGHCTLDGLFMILLPVIILVLSQRKGASTQPGWSGFMTILSFSALGWAGLRFTCGADNFAHAFVMHFIPFLATGILIGLLTKRIFRW